MSLTRPLEFCTFPLFSIVEGVNRGLWFNNKLASLSFCALFCFKLFLLIFDVVEIEDCRRDTNGRLVAGLMTLLVDLLSTENVVDLDVTTLDVIRVLVDIFCRGLKRNPG